MSHLTPVNTTLSGVSGQMAYGERPLAPPITQEAGNGTVTTEGFANEKLLAFLAEGLKSVLDAELQLLAALPMVAEEASSAALVNIVEDHMAAVENHISLVHNMFEAIEVEATTLCNPVMEGHIVALHRAIAKTTKGTALRNAQLINVLHKIARYHEAAYLSLLTIARIVNNKKLVEAVEQLLTQKHATGNMFAKLGTELNPENFSGTVIHKVPYTK